MDVHPNWHEAVGQILYRLMCEFGCKGRSAEMSRRIANVQAEYGTLDTWREAGRPAVHVRASNA